MAAQFNLTWDNTDVNASSNSLHQRASYRQKSVGGSFITTGFTPANDMAKTVNAATTPSTLLFNAVYEFKVENLCTVGGPTINDNGVREAIQFSCINPTTDQDHDSASISVNLTGLDITKVKFTLKKASDNTIVASSLVVKSGTSVAYNATGLTPTTNYYWQIELYANVNSVEVISSQAAYLDQPCSPYPFTTEANPTCAPITAALITAAS